MVKKITALLMLFLLLTTASAAFADTQIVDECDLFTASEEQTIIQVMDRIERNHQMDMVVLTTSRVPYDPSESMYRIAAFADDYYDQGGYGMGPDNSGMLLLIDMNNRAMYLSTGGVMMEYINDDREEGILDAAWNYMPSGQYGRAVEKAMLQTEKYLNRGREEGTFLYDDVTGERIGGIHNALTSGEMLVAAGAGVAVAVVIMASVGASYGLAGNTYKYDLDANSDCHFTRDDEQYLRQHVTRSLRSTGSSGGGGGGSHRPSGGSGVHRSSGGVRHGGGGRRF